MKIMNASNISTFCVGVYFGYKTPDDISEFLLHLVDKLKYLISNGITVNNKIIPFKVGALICDAPAKSFVCGVPSHTSSHGCTKCCQIGKKINNTLTYSTESGYLLSNEDFR